MKEQPLQFTSGAMDSFQEDASFGASHVSFKRESRVADDEEEEEEQDPKFNSARAGPIGRQSRTSSSVTDISSNSSIKYRRSRLDKIGSERFRCGAFCMHIPGLSRRRPMQQSMSLSEPGAMAGIAEPTETRASMLSKTASMERFKYRSSSGIAFDREGEEEDQEASAYFDLPLELLRSSNVDMESPVTAAFVFEGNLGWGLNKSVQAELPELEFSFPAPPAFSSPSAPRS